VESPKTFAFSPHGVMHHTRDEFPKEHGATAADIAAVEAFAHEHGLTVSQSSQARGAVTLAGTAEHIEQAFGVQLHHFSSRLRDYRGHTGPVMVPNF
jgi:kumamolisin